MINAAASIRTDERGGLPTGTAYAWIVFALTFGLLISDYMARQVLNAVFPLLKAEWQVTDGQLGLLSGIVAVMVGLLTVPLSFAADRWGRARSLAMMAILWSAATWFCAAATGYQQMLIGRALVGVGEAAYGSVGIAVVLSVFPRHMRATLSAAFMAGGLFGQVLGVSVGGQIAAAYGWRPAFAAIGIGGLALGVAYLFVVRDSQLSAAASEQPPAAKPPLRALFATRSVILAYLASGTQLFAAAALPAWLPSFFNRYHHLPVDRAGQLTALLLLICGAGMIVCGIVSDRISRHRPGNKIMLSIAYCIGSGALLTLAFQLSPGPVQLVALALAMFLVAGTTGPSGATVANLTPLAIHGSAFATLTLANNLIGLAPGPIAVGHVADSLGLLGALQLVPLSCVVAAMLFAILGKTYEGDLARVNSARA